jgi:hypothetical protein
MPFLVGSRGTADPIVPQSANCLAKLVKKCRTGIGNTSGFLGSLAEQCNEKVVAISTSPNRHFERSPEEGFLLDGQCAMVDHMLEYGGRMKRIKWQAIIILKK